MIKRDLLGSAVELELILDNHRIEDWTLIRNAHDEAIYRSGEFTAQITVAHRAPRIGLLSVRVEKGGKGFDLNQLHVTVRSPLRDLHRIWVPHMLLEGTLDRITLGGGPGILTCANRAIAFVAGLNRYGRNRVSVGLLDQTVETEVRGGGATDGGRNRIVEFIRPLPGMSLHRTVYEETVYLNCEEGSWFEAMADFARFEAEATNATPPPRHPDADQPLYCTWYAHGPFVSQEKIEAEAEVPPPEVQRSAHIRHFRHPVWDRWALDYFECFNELVADDIIHVCRTVKEACRYEKVVGVFYGYLMEMAWNAGYFYRIPSTNVPAYSRSGHLAVRKLLDSDVVDFFASPIAYGFRHIGGDAPFMTVHDSIKAHNKIYFAEDDSRTHRTGVTNQNYGAPKTARETVQILRRNFAQTLCRSSAIWWAGHGYASPLDEDLRACLADFRRIGDASMSLDRASASEVAVVIDERSLAYEGFSKAYDWPGIYLQRVFGLARLGAPHDVWLLDDLVNGVSPPYKLYFFLNPFRVTPEQRDGLRAHVLRDGATVIWGYASGVTDDRTFDPALMTDLTGIRFAMEDLTWGCEAVITNFSHPITEALPNNTHWGTPADLGPPFEVADPDATVLGIVVAGDGRCEPGIAIKEMGDWRSLYVGAPNIPSHVLRAIARYAGVHLYSEHDDVLYANRSFVALHTLKKEEKRIVLPEPRPVYEVFGRRQVVENETILFTDRVEAGETRLYYLGRGEDLRLV